MNGAYYICPNKECKFHHEKNCTGKWYNHRGYYTTIAFGRVQRFSCRECGTFFSDQTYSLNYFLKKKTDFKQLITHFNSSNSGCFIGRHNNLSSDSIRIRFDRLGRNALFFQSKLLENHTFSEPLCSDGFESYTSSKYYPNNLNILIGKESGFLYYFTHSYSRRKGKTTEKQKERIAVEYTDKSFKGSTLTSQFKEILRYVEDKSGGNQVHLFTDEHKTYDTLVRKHNESGKTEIIHDKTSSKEARTISNPLFVVNYYDMLLRKDCPMYRRRTICFARSSYNLLLRNAVYMLSHNYMKPVKIKSTAKQTDKKHCSSLGLDNKLLSQLKERVFTMRFLMSKTKLPKFFKQVWTKTVDTPLSSMLVNSVPKFALQ